MFQISKKPLIRADTMWRQTSPKVRHLLDTLPLIHLFNARLDLLKIQSHHAIPCPKSILFLMYDGILYNIIRVRSVMVNRMDSKA